MHARKQIRDAVVTALTGLTTTGANVFVDEPHDLAESQLPCLSIDDADEQLSYESGTGQRQQMREYGITVACKVQSSGAVHELRDQVAGEVETAMAAQVASGLSGLVSGIDHGGTEFSIDGAGSRPIAVATIHYVCRYYTAEV